MSTPTSDNPDNSHDLDELTRLSSLMDRLSKKVDVLENENQRLNEEIKVLKTTTVKLETLNIVFVQEQKKTKELFESKLEIGADEVQKLSSSMKDVTKRLEYLENQKKKKVSDVENAELKTRTFILEENLQELVQEANRIKQSIASQSVVEGASNAITQVGFTAVLTKPAHLGPLQTIIYDKAITNIGKGYDIRHGHFSAPVRGLYLISATTLSSPNAEIRTEIIKENEKLATMYCKSLDMGSHTVIVFLNEKEQVWVRHFDDPTAKANSGGNGYYSSFSGVLIAAS